MGDRCPPGRNRECSRRSRRPVSFADREHRDAFGRRKADLPPHGSARRVRTLDHLGTDHCRNECGQAERPSYRPPPCPDLRSSGRGARPQSKRSKAPGRVPAPRDRAFHTIPAPRVMNGQTALAIVTARPRLQAREAMRVERGPKIAPNILIYLHFSNCSVLYY